MKHRVFAFVLALCLLFGAAPGAFAGSYTASEQYQILLELDDLIRRQGLESAPDDDPLGRALVAALQKDPQLYETLMSIMLMGYDPYSQYIPAGDYSDTYGGETEYVGVGVTIRQHSKGALIAELAADGPAAAAGLRLNDVITHADGTALAGMELADISQLLRGEAGTQVTLQVLRGEQSLTVTVRRAKLEQLNYSGGHLEDGVYYMKWSRIDDQTSYLKFQLGLKELQTYGDTCLILDLRDNPGGSLDMAYSITANLIDEPVAFFETAWRDPRTADRLITDRVQADGTGLSIPHIFILTNGSTASAAEIITAGLRDTGRAVTVGATTYGKARAQQHVLLEDDSAIVLTTMALHSLTQGDYQDVGLTPDVPVENVLYAGEDAIRVPAEVSLAPYSCSDNGEALNRALVALGELEALPEKPYQVGDATLAACRALELFWLEDAPGGDGVSTRTLQLINYLLDLQGQGMYLQDLQLEKALELAREALARDAAR